MSLYLPPLLDVGGEVAICVVRISRQNTLIRHRCKIEAVLSGSGMALLLCNIEFLLLISSISRGGWGGHCLFVFVDLTA